MRARRTVEAAIQRALIRWAATTYPTSSLKITANNNEHARFHVDMGVDIGSPDLLITYRSPHYITQLLYLELKTTKGNLSPAQIVWNNEFDRHHQSVNCKRAVAYGFNQAKDIIADWLAIHGASPLANVPLAVEAHDIETADTL